jgi:monoamine oxidase
VPVGGVPYRVNGTSYSEPNPDTGFGLLWDGTAASPKAEGTLVQFVGGVLGTRYLPALGNDAAFGEADPADVARTLALAEAVFPGTTAAFDGRALVSRWHAADWVRGAYTCPGLGHYTTMFGALGLPEGNIHFCGEHTDEEYFGFMEGAVNSGERVAREIRRG